MGKVLSIENDKISVGGDDGKIVTVPLSAVNYQNPKIGDDVTVYRDGEKVIIAWAGKSQPGGCDANIPEGAKVVNINKHLFVWVGNFLFGGLGVDRFMRGQIGLGVVKLLFGWLTLGIWALVDFIISLTKAYGAYSDTENLTFINGKYSR